MPMRSALAFHCVLVFVLGLTAVAAGPATAQQEDGAAEPGERAFDRERLLTGHDGMFAPLNDPKTLTAHEYDELAGWSDVDVLGVAVDGRARAYPVPMLIYHHIANDVLGDGPIAVTW